MSRRGVAPGSAPGGGWLVSYANLLTVCLAVFIALYALARGEIEKLKAGLQPPLNPVAAAAPVSTAPVPPDLKSKIEDAVSAGLGAGQSALPGFETRMEEEGLLIRLAMPGFFREGSSSVEPELLPLLEKVGRVLLGSHAQIRIEGHADREELDRAALKGVDGWELGFRRAEFVSRFWNERMDFRSDRLALASYSAFKPLPSAKDPSARRFANRRIEIVVLKRIR